jgi:hypothetical protein
MSHVIQPGSKQHEGHLKHLELQKAAEKENKTPIKDDKKLNEEKKDK